MNHDDEPIDPPSRIFRGRLSDIPKTADAVVIQLPAKIEDSLNWKSHIASARELLGKGIKILFELDFGLFKHLPLPLENTMQFQSLALACRELRKLSKEIEISGVILGCIQAEELLELHWTEADREGFVEWTKNKFGLEIKPEQAAIMPQGRLALKLYAMEVHAHFLNILSDELIDSCPSYLLIDSLNISGSLEDLLLHSQEIFEPIECVFKNSAFFTQRPILQDFGSGECIKGSSNMPEPRVGVLIPNVNKATSLTLYQNLSKLLESVEAQPLFAIPEESITTSWDELEWLLMGTTPQDLETNRSIKGFLAAGGKVATLDDLSTFYRELSL